MVSGRSQLCLNWKKTTIVCVRNRTDDWKYPVEKDTVVCLCLNLNGRLKAAGKTSCFIPFQLGFWKVTVVFELEKITVVSVWIRTNDWKYLVGKKTQLFVCVWIWTNVCKQWGNSMFYCVLAVRQEGHSCIGFGEKTQLSWIWKWTQKKSQKKTSDFKRIGTISEKCLKKQTRKHLKKCFCQKFEEKQTND